ncbi:mating-type protein MAT1-2, partial [Usnea florida]
KIARPPNAFILYRQHHHPLIKASHPELHNNQISVILGTQWKDETESTKARYVGLAKKLKIKHFLEHPNYQYQPR